jgi:hypothetical protein
MGDLQVPTMGTIHNKGVLVGGLIAGAVLSMSDVLLYGSVLKAPMEAAWRAAGRPRMTDLQRTLEVPASIFLDFVVGIVLMWLYAAMQPRFRASLGTAVRAGLVAWFLAALLCAAFMFQGVMPLGIMNITILVLLVEYPLAVVLGAKLYVDGAVMAPLSP